MPSMEAQIERIRLAESEEKHEENERRQCPRGRYPRPYTGHFQAAKQKTDGHGNEKSVLFDKVHNDGLRRERFNGLTAVLPFKGTG